MWLDGFLDLPVSAVHALHVLLQLVLALELPPARLTHELPVAGVPQHVELQLVWPWEDLLNSFFLDSLLATPYSPEYAYASSANRDPDARS